MKKEEGRKRERERDGGASSYMWVLTSRQRMNDVFLSVNKRRPPPLPAASTFFLHVVSSLQSLCSLVLLSDWRLSILCPKRIMFPDNENRAGFYLLPPAPSLTWRWFFLGGGFVFWILRHRRSHNLIWMFHKSEHEQTQLWIIFCSLESRFLQPIREVCVLKTNCWLVLFCVFCSVILSYCFRSLLRGTRWSHVVSASINNCNLVQWFGWSCLNSLYRVS